MFAFTVFSSVVSGAAVDRYESAKPAHTAVGNLLDAWNERRHPEDNGLLDYDEDEEEYNNDEEEYELSGDYQLPRVEFSRKPKDPITVVNADTMEVKRRRDKVKKRGKGKGKKRNPCFRKYKDFCIHGTCQYLKDTKGPSCICNPGYSGERCHFFSLLVKSEGGYNRTTALAVVAVVLSSLCLTIIGLLLALRFHKRGVYDVENEEKVKLGSATQH
ncbi:heparin-binding EGF-like growth factor a [Chanos chanos]|uniref:Proheparin-binding EGF-like growth factor n=1 Tax=Chanos chanos TaxID=29144 RepID=A0A6J2W9F4_CHACN|nr:proheparin-binding EGF-like growth factor [Chanos chanos]